MLSLRNPVHEKFGKLLLPLLLYPHSQDDKSVKGHDSLHLTQSLLRVSFY